MGKVSQLLLVLQRKTAAEQEGDRQPIVGEDIPIETPAGAAARRATRIEKEVIDALNVVFQRLQVFGRSDTEGFHDFQSALCAKLAALGGRLVAMKLDVRQREMGCQCKYLFGSFIDKHAELLAFRLMYGFDQFIVFDADTSRGGRIIDEADSVGSGCKHFADILRVLHSAYFIDKGGILDKLAERFARLPSLHECLSDKEAAETLSAQDAKLFGTTDAALRDQQRLRVLVRMLREKTTDSPDKLKGVCNGSMERPQIAIVYPQHIHFGAKAPKFFLRMDFEQDLKSQLVGELCQAMASLRWQNGRDKEHRICPQKLGFIQLISIDDEVFPEQRQVHEEACLTQIFIFSSEETFIRQDRTGRGTGSLVGRDN